MVFAEKLDFLMKLTSTTNKCLGDLLSIHQSQISRMRSGSRGIPGNSEYIRIMAEHFASQCTQDFQRSALAEALGRPPLRLPVEKNVLSIILSEWLIGAATDGGEKAELYLRNYGKFNLSHENNPEDALPMNKTENTEDIFVYYGNSGKRAAVLAFLGYMMDQKEPQEIDVNCDENLEWLEEDPDYIAKIQQYMSSLAEKNFTCRRIVAPVNDLDYAYASLRFRWLPLLITGRVLSYYYPRLRDAVYHRMLIVARGKAAVFSITTGRSSESRLTFYIKDPGIADTLDAEFEDYLSMCTPHMSTTSAKQNMERFANRFTEVDTVAFPCIQRSNSLSFVTMPEQLASSIRTDSPAKQKIFANQYAKRVEAFQNVVQEHSFTDIIYLARPDEVSSGQAKILCADVFDAVPNAYSVDSYILHLKNILRIMETYPNYHLMITDRKEKFLSYICVKESHRALLIRESDPHTVLEISERIMVSAFCELVHRAISSERTDGPLRTENAARIRETIRQLETF